MLTEDSGRRNFSILFNVFMDTGCAYLYSLPNFICNIKPVSQASKHARPLDSANGKAACGVESEEPTVLKGVTRERAVKTGCASGKRGRRFQTTPSLPTHSQCSISYSLYSGFLSFEMDYQIGKGRDFKPKDVRSFSEDIKLIPSHKEDEELSGNIGVPWHLAVLVHHTLNVWSPEGMAMLCRRHRGDLPWGPESPCMLFLYRRVS